MFPSSLKTSLDSLFFHPEDAVQNKASFVEVLSEGFENRINVKEDGLGEVSIEQWLYKVDLTDS